MVSHDREFLTRTVTRVVELDLAQQQVNHYGGGYEAYLEEREIARRHAREAYEEYADTRAGLEARARMQRAWMEKGVRNARRKATDNDKIGRKFRAESTREAGGQGPPDRAADRAAGGGRGAAQGVGAADGDRRRAPRRRGRGDAARRRWCGAATFTLGPVDLQIDWADRVAITGANGSGKSTLLGALLGRVPLDDGQAHARPRRGRRRGRPGPRRSSSATSRCSTRSARPCRRLPPADVRTLLAKFGLRSAHVLRPAATLSPGERTRAALALLQARGVNLLVLDEPTNHLDLPAIEQLESALDSYTGHAAAGHPRPPDARRGPPHPRLAVEAGKVTEI